MVCEIEFLPNSFIHTTPSILFVSFSVSPLQVLIYHVVLSSFFHTLSSLSSRLARQFITAKERTWVWECIYLPEGLFMAILFPLVSSSRTGFFHPHPLHRHLLLLVLVMECLLHRRLLDVILNIRNLRVSKQKVTKAFSQINHSEEKWKKESRDDLMATVMETLIPPLRHWDCNFLSDHVFLLL